MFCPKCGKQFEEAQRCCSNCGYELPNNVTLFEANNGKIITTTPTYQDANRSPNLTVRTVFFLLAAVVLAMSLYSAHCITTGGMDISSIESVGGQTLEEAYYQYSGMVYTGYAAAVRATGIFFASVLSYLGIKG